MDETRYGLMVKTRLDPASAETAIRAALADEGFGILTEIDVAATMKAKLGLDRTPYKILGACNPVLANQALDAESDIGLLLPCNVAVYAEGEYTVVSVMEPRLMAQVTANDGLIDLAEEARRRLAKALEALD